VQAEDLVLNDGGHWYVVKEIGEHGPYVFGTVLLEALIVETINLRYAA
jgi:hypothetical protein